MAKATSKDGKEYQIGSERGNDFLNNARVGSTMTGGDGSTWTKNADGSTTISKNGTTYTVGGSNAGSGGSSTGKSSTSGGAPSGFKGSATNVNTYTRDQDAIKAEMNANSKKWHSATQEEQEQLHAANEALSRLLGGDVSFDAASGTWNGSAEQIVQKPSSGGNRNFTDFTYEEAPSYNNRYEEKVDDLVQEILKRDPFSYNYADDPLYQIYAGIYQRNGDLAMRDTLGEMAARTGGLSSSYAGSVAQGSYNNYMQGLSEIVPELYSLAYSMYQDEENGERANLEMLRALESGDYEKYRDLLAQYNTDRAFDYGILSDQIGLDYQREQDALAAEQDAREWAYKVQQGTQRENGTTGTPIAGNTTADTDDQSGLFTLADEFALSGGDPEDYIKANWRKYNYKSQSEALSAYNVYLTEKGNSGGESAYNSAYFQQAMTSLNMMLAQGNADGAIDGIDSFWNKLSKAQKQQVQETLARYGYSYEED